MKFTLIICIILAESFFGEVGGQIPECTESDLHYTYTECDADKSRWRVYVPKSNTKCYVGSPKPPVQGPPCDKSCDAGRYLDVAGDQDCIDCPAGTYSVGNGVRYDQWDSLPKEFTVVSNGLRLSLKSLSKAQCEASVDTWVAQGPYLEGVPSDCNKDLSITTELITDGSLTIRYRNTLDMLGIVQVKSLCQSTAKSVLGDFEGITPLKKSKSSGFDITEIDMKPGKNKITFSLLGLNSAAPGNKFIIQSIEIKGMGFSTECTPCKPGFYSSIGSSHCTRCGANTYAPLSRSVSCKDCKEDEFSPPGAKECKPRPPCTESDYYASIAPCVNGTTYETYQWLDNKYCNDKHADSVILPKSGGSKECPSCNPGESLADDGTCEYCPEGQSSDGSQPCESCPIGTEARKSKTFIHFDVMPSGLYPGCIKLADGGSFCDKQSTWVPKGDYIQVSDDIRALDFAVLNINNSHFANRTLDGRVYGKLVIRFNLTCDPADPCIFYLMQEDSVELRVVGSWNATTTTVYMHNFTSPDVKLISIAFRKSSKAANYLSSNTLSISELRLINTVSGGATECTPCVLGSSAAGEGCHSCAVGEIVVTNNVTNKKVCKKCPANYIAQDSFTCIPCGPGLVNNEDHTMCVSDCQFAYDGMKFDLSSLSGAQTFAGANMFTADGTTFHHNFNFVLCSGATKGLSKPPHVTCINNATIDSYYRGKEDTVSSLVCRETILPAESVLSIQPTSLGDWLANVTVNNQIDRKLLKEGGTNIHDDELSIHFKYVTYLPTDNCPQGISTVVTLICDTREVDNGSMALPPKCYGGTCDGCTYQIRWRTKLACPKCDDSHYERIVGQCEGGQQTVRYMPDKYCPMTEEIRNRQSVEKCTLLTLPIKIAVASTTLVVLLLFLCAVCCWKRSRKLEYKYMRLVEGAQGKPGELPAAQTCAWSDDDEEDVNVGFKTKGDQLFGKLTSKKDKNEGFEKIKLVGGRLPEI